MDINWASAEVQAAAISSIGSLLATTITALGAFFVGKRFIDQKYLKDRLLLAQGDIAFLLAVEAEHCKHHAALGGQSLKSAMRKAAREQGFEWSGRFTPSRAKDREVRLTLVAGEN